MILSYCPSYSPSMDSSSYKCKNCQMWFSSPAELASHSKNFCVRSPYGNVQSLEEKQRIRDTFEPVNLTKSKLGAYGNYSLEAMKNLLETHPTVNLSQQAMRNREDELRDDVLRYQERERRIRFNEEHPQLKSDQEMQTSIVRNMRGSKHDNNEFCSPPSYLPGEAVKKTQMSYAKHQSAVKNMTEGQRRAYADTRLAELEDIKLNYLHNNGTDGKFLGNLKNLHDFYQNLKISGVSNAENRLKTPIARLGGDEDSLFKSRAKTSQHRHLENTQAGGPQTYVRPNPTEASKPYQVAIHNSRLAQQQPLYQQQYQYSPLSPTPNQIPPQSLQPIIIMPPPYYHQDPSLRRSTAQHNQQENTLMKRLEQLLLNKEHPRSQPPEDPVPTHNSPAQKPDNNLLIEQRVLEALQREEFEELRLLSSLPQDLQKVKLGIIKETTSLRGEMEKQIQQQRILRMRHQLEMQEDQEKQLLDDEIWVDRQRRKEVSRKLIEEER